MTPGQSRKSVENLPASLRAEAASGKKSKNNLTQEATPIPDPVIEELGQDLEAFRAQEAADAALTAEEAQEEFIEDYETLEQLSGRIAALEQEFRDRETRLVRLAKIGGAEYVPNPPVAPVVISSELKEANSKIKIPITVAGSEAVEVKEKKAKDPRKIEIGQAAVASSRPKEVFNDRTRDTVSEKAFNNEKQMPDERQHRRVSVNHATTVHETKHNPPQTLSLKDRLTPEERSKIFKKPPKGFEVASQAPEAEPEEEVTLKKKDRRQAAWDSVSVDLKRATEATKPEDNVIPWLEDSAAVKPFEAPPAYVAYPAVEVPKPPAEQTPAEAVTDEANPEAKVVPELTDTVGRYDNEPVWIVEKKQSPDGSRTLVTYKTMDGEIVTVDESDPKLSFVRVEIVETPEVTPEAKGFLAKTREKLGMIYWRTRYAASDAYDKTLNIGVDQETMSEEEIKKKKDRNRTVLLVTAGTVAGLIVGSLVTAGIINNANALNNANDLQGGDRTPGGGFKGGQGGEGSTQPDYGHRMYPDGNPDFANPGNESGGDPGTAPEAVEAPAAVFEPYSISTYDIPYGDPDMGGHKLFEQLGIDISKWNDNASYMLKNFPKDFYLEGTDVRIKHSGWLAPDTQQFIESLR